MSMDALLTKVSTNNNTMTTTKVNMTIKVTMTTKDANSKLASLVKEYATASTM